METFFFCPFVPLSLCSFRQDSLVVELPAHNRFVAGSIPAPACLFSIFGPFFPSDFPLENPLESSSGKSLCSFCLFELKYSMGM
jgi:hypothetical protein